MSNRYEKLINCHEIIRLLIHIYKSFLIKRENSLFVYIVKEKYFSENEVNMTI